MEMAGEIDAWVFRWINLQLVHPACDDLMVFLTTFKLSSHIFLLAGVFVLVRKGRSGMAILAIALLSVGISDFIASGILKPFVQRIRPCFALDSCRLLINQSHSYSFASSHAANSAAAASVIWIFFHRGSPVERFFVVLMAFYALLVGYSRIYVGVHYPGDVLAGVLIGCASAAAVYAVSSWFFKNLLQPHLLGRRSSQS
ncbi:MAG: phosphatase PAP2 family protein [Chlorobi bacterium]|nr:phosphatase PAP2 family protein [Chlorobiota bacterium]